MELIIREIFIDSYLVKFHNYLLNIQDILLWGYETKG